ncbi:MAG: 16S rRNA (cytosine(967)-C(5))-methyltransferase RsmB [Vicinamibacterales bacterium]
MGSCVMSMTLSRCSNPSSCALDTLRRVHTGHADLASALEHGRARLADERDQGLAAEIALGTLRWRAALDHVIAWAGERAVEAFDSEVLDILRLSAYQLLHLDRVPASAAVNDAVSLARQRGHIRAAGAINAILRRISRNRTRLPMPEASDPMGCLSITWSHPAWLAARWLDRYGFDAALEWVRFNNAPAPLTLRANTLQTSRDALGERLEREGVRTRPCVFAPDGLVVESGRPFSTSLAVAGQFLAQDEASQIVGAFAAPPAGGRVLDTCASPGGKTAQLAAAIGAGGLLVAGDLRSRRIRLLRQTLRAARITSAHIVVHDLMGGAPFGPVFDCVLVDAPCSSLGTIRRDPDIRWSRREGDLAALALRQGRMLDEASCVVRPGGLLVYATCSSEPEENDRVVDGFLGRHGAFVLEDPRAAGPPLPGGVAACLDRRGCLRTLPHAHALEAFFGARLRRRR